jgi:CelD/BcsL family acetyltransferase involved in cellulose biosynthesis
VKLTAYDQGDVFDRLKPEWNDLVSRSHADTVFSTWEWQYTWWNAYEPGNLWVIECREDDGRLVGVAPWYIEMIGDERVLVAVGCVDVTDYLDLIVDVDCTQAVFEHLATFMAENRHCFDRISLCNIPENSPTVKYFSACLELHGFAIEIEQADVCPVIELPDQWTTYVESLGKKDRHELRRKIRRASASSELDWYIVNESHDLNEEIERFSVLMAASDPEKEAFLADEANQRFFRQIVPIMFEQGWLQLNFITADGDVAAGYFNLCYKDRILVYNSGLMRGKYDHLSAGIVLLSNNIRYAIENGYRIFDFLRGNETYKYRMGGHDTIVYTLNAR